MRHIFAVTAVFVCGCGGPMGQIGGPPEEPVTVESTPKAGDSCTNGEGLCYSNEFALVCERSEYREIPCKGPTGCTSNTVQFFCDMKGNVPGDACPFSQEGSGICNTSNKKQVLQCTGGTFVIHTTCTNECVEFDGQIGCR